MLQVDVQQAFVSTAAVFGIGLVWVHFNKRVYEMVRYLIFSPFMWPEDEIEDESDVEDEIEDKSDVEDEIKDESVCAEDESDREEDKFLHKLAT